MGAMEGDSSEMNMWSPSKTHNWWNTTFHLPESVKSEKLTVYENCNKHGLWMGNNADGPDNGGGGHHHDDNGGLGTGQVVALLLGGVMLLCVGYFVYTHFRTKKESKQNKDDYSLMT